MELSLIAIKARQKKQKLTFVSAACAQKLHTDRLQAKDTTAKL